ncbi:MAG: hypothetical protein ACTHMY_24530 [Solirubrobacteraceae bacterium]
MLLTIALILAATIAVAALELWLFWRVGEREKRRRGGMRADVAAADAETSATGKWAGVEETSRDRGPARPRGRSTSRTVARKHSTPHRRRSAHQ